MKRKDILSISIVIPNYNGRRLLEKNLPKVISQIIKLSNYQIEIVIVDDNSSDDSMKYLRDLERERYRNLEQKKPKFLNLYSSIVLKVILNEQNLGFASTVDRGVRAAKGEIVVLLNTDVCPEKGFLEAVLPHFKDPKVFAVGMMDKSIEDGNIVRRGRGVGKWRQGFYVHQRGEIDRTDTAWVSGGSGAFRKSIWKKLGGFDEIYNPFYWEDIDLSYRAKKAGYKILFEPKSAVVHEHGKGIIKSNYSPNYIKKISYRNQFLFVWKNANLVQLISHLLWLPYHIIKAIICGDIWFLTGFLWAIKRKLTFRS